jgi:hypothetical protein
MRSVIVLLSLASVGLAQSPPRFLWTAGDVHTFAVEHDTTVAETTAGVTNTTTTKLRLTRTWTVQSVDAAGTATLAMAITQFRSEMIRPVPGEKDRWVDETTVIDSATPEGAKQVGAYVGKTILTCKVDARGRVSEIQSTTGDTRLAIELPFRFECPETDVKEWTRPLTITLAPPVGTGEKHEAVQSMKFTAAGIDVATALKTPPTDPAELQPLLPFLWEGTVVFQDGRYHGAKLAIKKEIPNHQGKGTKFEFASRFEETRK